MICDPSGPRGPPGLALAAALVSAGVIAYQVVLTRVLAILQWHHYAYLIISLALLGFGASGSFLVLAAPWLRGRVTQGIIVCAIAFGLSSVGAVVVASAIPFNPLRLAWDLRELAWLGGLYLVLTVPFFFAAAAVGLALMGAPGQVARVYGANLIGSGIGGVVAIWLLWLPLAKTVQLMVVPGVAAALLVAWPRLARAGRLAGCCALLGVSVVLVGGQWISIQPSEYKDLRQALRTAGARVVAERTSPLGWLVAVENTTVPFRRAPGLSLLSPFTPPPQIGVFVDGDGAGAVNVPGTDTSLAFLDYLGSAVAYHLIEAPSVLLLGAGVGIGVQQAHALGARSVDAVEPHAELVDMVREDLREAGSHPFDRPDVTLHTSDPRVFVSAAKRRFDVIQLDATSSSASGGGVHALSASHIYTVEAVRAYLRRLTPGGLLAMTRWVQLPPRESIKLFAIAAEALRGEGIVEPERHLAWLRSWKTSTLLVGRQPITASQIAELKSFARIRAFDLAYYPGMRRSEANQHNRLAGPQFFDAALALLGEDAAVFTRAYAYDVRPATDNRPFFFDFFRWSSLGQIVDEWRAGGGALLELGYPLVLATVVQAALAGAVLIILPLLLRQGRRSVGLDSHGARALGFFFAIGLGFLLVELTFVQKLLLVLEHPVYALALVLSAFLVFAGLGSWLSAKVPSARIGAPVWPLLVVIGVYAVAWSPIANALLGLSQSLRVFGAALLIAPLALLMGTLFPRALESAGRHRSVLVPWAWGVNGCASVISAPLAVLIAMHWGYTATLLLAMLCYGGAAVLGHRSFDRRGG